MATSVESPPIAIRGHVPLRPAFVERIRKQLASRLGHVTPVVERGTVRFEDINGPKGGTDTVCRIKLVVRGRPSLVVADLADRPERAFASALPRAIRLLERERAKHGLSGARRSGPRHPERRVSEEADSGELIGRRTGRGKAGLARALARPEKERRDAYVDTSRPGVSASDRRAGGISTARRNTRAKHPRAAAALEDSRTKPSRKSTRRSANRGKPSHGKERTALARSVTPSARAARR